MRTLKAATDAAHAVSELSPEVIRTLESLRDTSASVFNASRQFHDLARDSREVVDTARTEVLAVSGCIQGLCLILAGCAVALTITLVVYAIKDMP